MANRFPYVPSGGPLIRTITHLRRSFPKEVTADTLRKLGVAPKNESYVINVLRFLGVIDDAGKKVDAKAKALVQHQEAAFSSEFGKLVKEAYEELFDLHGDSAWDLDKNALTQFFRTTDHSSSVVGSRQATTFVSLAGLSGHGSESEAIREVQSPRTSKAERGSRSKKTESPAQASPVASGSSGGSPVGAQEAQKVGLTVRIEVNLPANGDQETYDRIFQSIRKNLIDGKSA